MDDGDLVSEPGMHVHGGASPRRVNAQRGAPLTVSVRYIDPFSNRGLGTSLGAATRRLDDGARFMVTVEP
jgi:hypothetical protein